MSNDDRGYLWERRHQIVFRAELSALYHQKRERFFEFLDKITKAVSVFGGSAALMKASSESTIVYLAAAITFASVVSLVFGFSDKARRHADLSGRYRSIIAEITGTGERDFDEEHIKLWDRQVRLVEVNEPPTLATLARLCQYELALSAGQEKTVRPVSWHEKLLMHFFDMPVKSA